MERVSNQANLIAPSNAETAVAHSPSAPSRTVWFTGLSGAGKTSLAQLSTRLLAQHGIVACMIDGDQLRDGLSRDLGFGEASRTENVRRAAEVAKLLNAQGLWALVSLISPLTAHRDMARRIVGAPGYFEVYVSTPLQVCEARDVKGLYARARAGEIGQFTGISAPYEVPRHADLEIDTQATKLESCCGLLLDRLLSIGRE